jgi:hypothetical protein
MVPAGSLSLYQTAAVWKDFFNIVEIGVGNENENECKCDNIITQGNVSKSVNMWIVGEATSNGGTKSCYISNNGKDNTYSSGYSDAYNYYPYFYIDVDVNTTGEDMATISFDWKLEQGDINYVYIGVGITDTTTVISDVNLPSYIQTLDKYYYNDSIWKHETINIPAALSGKKRIIFYWYGYSYAYNNAGAIDNIIIHTNTDIGDVELDFENVSDIKTNGIKWTLCDDGVLCVTGTGNIPSRFENVLNPYIDQIKTVIIKDGIINIGDYAFRNLISLTEITIPDSVTLIGSEVFSNCISLTKVVIPNSVTTIGYGAFYNCISLTDLTIGSGISTLETLWDYTSTQESKWIVGEATSNGGTKSCYVSNNGLNNICSNYEWSQSFFYRDVEIISTLSDPAAITFDYKFNIQSNANWNYMQMFVCETNVFPTSSYLPSLSSSIKLNTAATWTQYTHNLPPMNGKKRIIFMWYHQYNMNNEQPPAVDNIVIKTNMSSDIIENFENGGGDWNFSNGYNPVGLKRVKIADSDTPLSFNTYYSPFGNFVEELYLGRNIENNNNSPFGTNLKKIEISSYVDNIPHHFCTNCLFLSEFEIPANINRIGDGAFTGCLQLKELNISDSDHELNLDSNTSPFGNSIEKVYMGRNTKWNNGIISSSLFGVQLKDITFSDKVDHLTDYMFKDCRFLSNDTTYPATIQTYGDGVFYGCQNLTEIPGLKYGDRINKDFFRNCTGLTTVIIPVSVTTLGKNCFADCDGLSNIAMPNTITKMEENVFSSCDSLTEFVIPNSITEISDGLLKDCKKLKKVMIPSSVTKIGYLAFYGCILLDEVNSLQSVKQIGDGAFGNCYNLTNVVLSGTITDIGDYCFQNCINLNNVIIPNTITKIGSHLFYGCTKLANVTLSNNITEIGESAFWQCIVLNSVVIPNSVIKIGNNAFLACVKLKNMIIPNAVTALENGVFRGSGIKSITIPDGVTSIGSNVFFDCLELTAVVIPNTVNSIGTNAFYDCSVLSDITNKSVTPQEINDTLFNGVDKATCVLRVPSASVNVYKAHAKWGLFTNIVAI